MRRGARVKDPFHELSERIIRPATGFLCASLRFIAKSWKDDEDGVIMAQRLKIITIELSAGEDIENARWSVRSARSEIVQIFQYQQ